VSDSNEFERRSVIIKRLFCLPNAEELPSKTRLLDSSRKKELLLR
jgi:hypothetical protein